ncbi:hypothetical protein [Thalassotalea sediminis]|uniref:hypothetical protein n=1 Tax=Thalassotalea sediminis TaxID=1759089 RepID=UPI0025726578|nr:hypothetical protein [Thalassotalea sediminis]
MVSSISNDNGLSQVLREQQQKASQTQEKTRREQLEIKRQEERQSSQPTERQTGETKGINIDVSV